MNQSLLQQKLEARSKSLDDFQQALTLQINKLLNEPEVHKDFIDEMSRFVSTPLKERTLDNPDYWPYVQKQINEMASQVLQHKGNQQDLFNMNNL